MVSKKRSGSLFKILLITLLVISQFIIGIIFYENWHNGKWNDIVQKLNFILHPLFEYLQRAGSFVVLGTSWLDKRIDDIFPNYYETISVFLEPYRYLFLNVVKLICIGCQNTKERIVESYPVVLQNIDYYAPGLIENSQKMVSNAYENSAFYISRSVDYLKKEVFIGQLSPENVQRVVSEALNTTQQKASEYYYWVYEKVHTTIK